MSKSRISTCPTKIMANCGSPTPTKRRSDEVMFRDACMSDKREKSKILWLNPIIVLNELTYGAGSALILNNISIKHNSVYSCRKPKEKDGIVTRIVMESPTNVKENVNGRPQPLLQEPHFGSRPQPFNPYSTEQPRTYDEIVATAGYGETFPAADPFRKTATPATELRDQRSTQFQQPGAVLMVYGLDPLRTNADKLFNLMCLYGNVARIKFLKSKEGTAMVQMGDSVAVERCVQNLNNVAVGLTGAAPLTLNSKNKDVQNDTIKEHKLQLAFSKQPFLSEVTNPYPLPDKSPSYKLYINNKNNRFMNPAMASKNRIQPPSKILHFFNTPPQVTEEELFQVFKDYDVVPPKAVKLFPMKSERSSSGLLEFENTTDAVAAVMACNHAAIESPGNKFPFIMKLCFSSSRSMNIRNGDNTNGAPADKQDH